MGVFLIQLDIVKLELEMPFFCFLDLPCIKGILRDVVLFGHLVPISYLGVIFLPEIILSYQRITRELDCSILTIIQISNYDIARINHCFTIMEKLLLSFLKPAKRAYNSNDLGPAIFEVNQMMVKRSDY